MGDSFGLVTCWAALTTLCGKFLFKVDQLPYQAALQPVRIYLDNAPADVSWSVVVLGQVLRKLESLDLLIWATDHMT